ncbi:MAG: hypothetical protein ACYTA3_08420 [Planctomycetota bacterium]
MLGSESHSALLSAVESSAGAVEDLQIVPTLNSFIGDMSDHHAFRVAGQPYVFLSCGRGIHYLKRAA